MSSSPLSSTVLSSGFRAPAVFVVTAAASSETLTFGDWSDATYDLTLNQSCTIAIGSIPVLSGIDALIPRRITLIIRPNGYQATLPASNSSLVWAGGSAPTPSPSLITVVEFFTDGTLPIFGGF